MKKQTINASEFLEMFGKMAGTINEGHLVVSRGYTNIDGMIYDRNIVQIENVTFIESVNLSNFRNRQLTMIFDDCEFLGGLYFRGVECNHISINAGQAKHLDIKRCKALSVSIIGVGRVTELDLSSVSLTEHLRLLETEFTNLKLFDPATLTAFTSPRVETDSIVAAMQFNLAGIPVFANTELVRGILETKCDELTVSQ